MFLPRVSIITVCYNSEQTIEQTILSVLGQTYCNIEYIIIDGGSIDNTLNIIKKYGKDIKLISEHDEGIYHAMNKGIMCSSGEIIGIINSDDWYEANAVELSLKYLKNDDCDLTYGKCKCIYKDQEIGEDKCDDLKELRYRMTISHPTVFVKKKIYEKYGIFNQKYRISADYDLMLRFYECGVRMTKIPENIAFFRITGVSRRAYEGTLKETREIALYHWDGKSIDIKNKIEQYAEYRSFYQNIMMVMNQPIKNIKKVMADLFPNDNGYVIFGVGCFGIQCVQFLKENQCEIDFLVDNDLNKCGNEYFGVKVYAPDYLLKVYKNIIISNVYHKEEISKQLLGMNFIPGVDFVYFEDILKACMKV